MRPADGEPYTASMDARGDGAALAVWEKWQDPRAGARYAGASRWRTPRAAQRDPMLVERILDRYGVRPAMKPVLDAPCGAARLRGVIERRGMRWVGADVSEAMLREARSGPQRSSSLVRALAGRLPFRDDSFDVVVCCRLLHHLHDEEEVEAVVGELVRVSARMVIASFWDSASLHAWRRRVGLRRSEGPSGRRAVSKRLLRRAFDAAGAEVVEFEHSFRFVSQQAFAVALKRAPVEQRSRGVVTAAKLFELDVGSASGSLGQA